MAPGADITYIGAPNNYRDMDAIMNRVVDKHLADIVTNSYGYGGEALPAGTIKPSLDTQIQAAAEGITLFFSSGDNGDETGGVAGATPDPGLAGLEPLGHRGRRHQRWCLPGQRPASSSSAGRPPRARWTRPPRRGTPRRSSTAAAAAPRGCSPSRPTRRVSSPSAISQTYGGGAMRSVPDVAALGDPNTGMLVGETQTFPDGSQQLLRVPHRRHLARLAALRGHVRPGPAEGGSRVRPRQPGALRQPAAPASTSPRPTSRPTPVTCAPTTSTASTPPTATSTAPAPSTVMTP